MANPRILKNFNLFVDGRGFAGVIDELELPELSINTVEHRAGGMDGTIEIDMGQEAMEANFTLAEYDPETLALWGLSDGNAVQLTARGAMQRDGEEVIPVKVNFRGHVKVLGQGTWTAGEKVGPEFTVGVRYYKHEVNGTVIIEIDVENMKRIVNGKDQLEGIRNAIGV